MGKQQHNIQKMILDLEVEEQKGAVKLQDEVASIFQNHVFATMEEVFDELCPEDMVIELDQLSIDLGNIEKEKIDVTTYNELKKQIDEVIKKELPKAVKTSLSKKEVRKPKSQSQITLLQQFFETGVLPWWKIDEGKVAIQPLFEKLLDESPSEMKRVIGHLLKVPSSRRRMAYQLADHQLKKIVYSVVPTLSKWVEGSSIQELSLKETARVEKWQVVLEAINELTSPTQKKLPIVLASMVQSAVKNRSFTLEELKQVLNINVTNSAQEVFWKQIVQLEKQKEVSLTDVPSLVTIAEETMVKNKKTHEAAIIIEEIAQKIIEALPKEKQKKINRIQEENKVEDEKGKSTKVAQKDTAEKEVDAEVTSENKGVRYDEVYINNAGIVIMWPYLTTFFKRLGYVEGKSFISEERQQRAALLLQFIITGSSKAEEHELVLNKLLCGIALEETLPLEIELTEEEEAEAINLINAVITNWKAMDGSSPDGLRETFLIREGALEDKDDHWTLRIERKGVDILIDQLEWGFSMIRLAWNEKVIYVEW